MEVTIEICSNCKEHAWCTRHNEATYLTLAEELVKAIKSQRQNAQVDILKVGGHKMGSFQVTCNGYLLFSKLALGYFPHITLLTNRIFQFIDDSDHGRDLSKYKGGLSPIKYHPHLKNSGQHSPEKPPANKSTHQFPTIYEKLKEQPQKSPHPIIETKVEPPQKSAKAPVKEAVVEFHLPAKQHKPFINQHHEKQKADHVEAPKEVKEEKKHHEEKQPSAHKQEPPRVKTHSKTNENHQPKVEKAAEPHNQQHAQVKVKHEEKVHLQTPKKEPAHPVQAKNEEVKHQHKMETPIKHPETLKNSEHKEETTLKHSENKKIPTEHKEVHSNPPHESQPKQRIKTNERKKTTEHKQSHHEASKPAEHHEAPVHHEAPAHHQAPTHQPSVHHEAPTHHDSHHEAPKQVEHPPKQEHKTPEKKEEHKPQEVKEEYQPVKPTSTVQHVEPAKNATDHLIEPVEANKQ